MNPKNARPVSHLVILGLAFAAAMLPQTVAAQPDHQRKHHQECRLAIQITVMGEPAPHRAWAARKVASCGEDAGAAVAAALRRSSSSADSAVHARLWDVTVTLRDAHLVAAAADVLNEAGATDIARIFAARALVMALQPTLYVRPEDLATGDCYGDLLPPHADPIRTGAPLPAGWQVGAHARATAVLQDPSTRTPVRRAAGCVLQHDAAEFRPAAEAPDANITVEDLTIQYVCGNHFRISNPYEIPMRVAYRALRTEGWAEALVPAEGEVIIIASETVRLYDEDRVLIGSAEHSHRVC